MKKKLTLKLFGQITVLLLLLSFSTTTLFAGSQDPVGNFAIMKKQCSVVAWAYDKEHPSKQIYLYVYVDGQYIGYTYPKYYNKSVNEQHGISGKHGYWFDIPAKFRDGKVHKISILAINIGQGSNQWIAHSPQFFKCQGKSVQEFSPGDVYRACMFSGFSFLDEFNTQALCFKIATDPLQWSI